MDGSPWAGMPVPGDGLAGATAALLQRVQSRIAMLAGGMSVVCGSVLVLRRFAGAFAAPPGPEAVVAICGAGLTLVAVGDLAARSPAARAAGHAVTWLPAVLSRLGLLMGVAAIGLPLRNMSSVDAVTTSAAVVISLVTLVRGPLARLVRGGLIQRSPSATSQRRSSPSTVPPPLAVVPMMTPPLPQPRTPAWLQDGSTSLPAGSILQRLERLALPEGAECVRGRLWVAVSKGARSGYGHVGFCPPLASQPTVDVTTDYDGVEAIVSAAEVLPWGVRIECRLDEPAEETIEIPVDIHATAAA